MGINFIKYDKKHLWQTFRANKKFQSAMERGASIEELAEIIDSYEVIYTQEQIEYIKDQL